jgi:hypothetical protein
MTDKPRRADTGPRQSAFERTHSIAPVNCVPQVPWAYRLPKVASLMIRFVGCLRLRKVI